MMHPMPLCSHHLRTCTGDYPPSGWQEGDRGARGHRLLVHQPRQARQVERRQQHGLTPLTQVTI